VASGVLVAYARRIVSKMSYVEIFKVERSGDVVSYGTVRNNHAGAPAIWNDLAKRHGFSDSKYVLMDSKGLESLWESIGTSKLERWEEVLLGCTLDFVWVPPCLVVEAARAFERWYKERGEGIVATTAGIARMMQEIAETDPGAGVAFNMCSAVTPYWYVNDGPCEEDDEAVFRPYNVITDREQLSGEYQGKTAECLSVVLKDSAVCEGCGFMGRGCRMQGSGESK
jgi:hypothetical protein